jgi:hypothetical protein
MRAWRSFGYVTHRVAKHMLDLMIHRRGMKLVNGNALVARLAKSAFDRGVDLRVSSPVRRLLTEAGRVVGAIVRDGGRDVEIRASRGVVLACGGFPHDPKRIAELFPHAPTGTEHRSAPPVEHRRRPAPRRSDRCGRRDANAGGRRLGAGVARAASRRAPPAIFRTSSSARSPA